MSRWLLLICLLLSHAAQAEEPLTLVHTRLTPDAPYQIGSTLRLEIDLLTSTWFTEAPQPPLLQLPGALISAPTGQADKLTVKQDGDTYFGLRLTYLISPTQAGQFAIPALSFTLTMGQASAPVQVSSQALEFSVQGASNNRASGDALVAQALRFEQSVERSNKTLQVGDSITRRISTQAEGTQAMLIPPPVFVQIEGLKRYLQPAEVKPLDNGRGAINGGQRLDSVSYVIEQPGSYELPTLELTWWDTNAGQLRHAAVPAVSFKATQAGAYQLPFSIEEDLRRLGRNSRIYISGFYLAISLALLLAGFALYTQRLRIKRRAQALQQWLLQRKADWRNSELFAWRQLQNAPKHLPIPLGKLYTWLQRSQPNGKANSLQALLPTTAAELLQQQLAAQYGPSPAKSAAPNVLRQHLQRWRRGLRRTTKQTQAESALRPLNPKR